MVLGGFAAMAGITAAFWAAAALMGASGLGLLLLFQETEPSRRTRRPAWQDHPEWVAPSQTMR